MESPLGAISIPLRSAATYAHRQRRSSLCMKEHWQESKNPQIWQAGKTKALLSPTIAKPDKKRNNGIVPQEKSISFLLPKRSLCYRVPPAILFVGKMAKYLNVMLLKEIRYVLFMHLLIVKIQRYTSLLIHMTSATRAIHCAMSPFIPILLSNSCQNSKRLPTFNAKSSSSRRR